MESSIWDRIKNFIRESLTQKFKAFLPGCIMGFIGSKSFLWNGVTLEVATYILKFIATVIMAFSSGLATSYAALIIDRLKNKKNVTPQRRRKRKGDKAA
jgi:hypothetical protein